MKINYHSINRYDQVMLVGWKTLDTQNNSLTIDKKKKKKKTTTTTLLTVSYRKTAQKYTEH